MRRSFLFLIVCVIFLTLGLITAGTYCHKGEPDQDIITTYQASKVEVVILTPEDIVSQTSTIPNKLSTFTVTGTASSKISNTEFLQIHSVKIRIDTETYANNSECTLVPNGSGYYDWSIDVYPSKYGPRSNTHIITAKAWDAVGSESESDKSGQFLVIPPAAIKIVDIDGTPIYNDMLINSPEKILISGTTLITKSVRQYKFPITGTSPVYVWIDDPATIPNNPTTFDDANSTWSILIDALDFPGTHQLCAKYIDNFGDEYIDCYTIKMGESECDVKIEVTAPNADAPNLCDITSTSQMTPYTFIGRIPTGAIQGSAFAGMACRINTVQMAIDTGAWIGLSCDSTGVIGATVKWMTPSFIDTCFYQSYIEPDEHYASNLCPSNSFYISGSVDLFGYPHVLKIRAIGEDASQVMSWNLGSRLVYFKNYINLNITNPINGITISASTVMITGTASGSYFVADPTIFDSSNEPNNYTWKYCWDTSSITSTRCTPNMNYTPGSNSTQVNLPYLATVSSLSSGTHVLFIFATDYCGTDHYYSSRFINIKRP